MNITRRIMNVDKGHTFSYGDKEYSVADLIEFTKGRKVINFQPGAFNGYLRETAVDRVWGQYDDYNKTEIPVTLHDLADHISRIEAADTKYPVILLEGKNGVRVLDGIHRILKAQLDKSIRLKGIYLSEADMAEFISR